MEPIKRLKTIRVRLLKREMLDTSPAKSKKKIYKVASKAKDNNLIEKSIEKDLELENGNPLKFLEASKDWYESIGYNKYESLSKRSSIGSNKKFEVFKEATEITPSSTKREIRKRTTLKSSLLPLLNNELTLITKIEGIKKQINQNKKSQNQKIKNLSYREKIAYLKQQRSLNRFEKTSREWKKIEEGLSIKSNKSPDELINKKKKIIESTQRSLLPTWSMTLRNNASTGKMENFIPVGNKLSGLYVRNIVPFEEPHYIKSTSCPELYVLGSSKLPLEIDALRKTGFKLIKPSDQQENNSPLMVAENYDFTNKFLKEL